MFEAGTWQGAARQFMSRYRDALIALPVAVFALAPELPDPMDSGGRRVLLEELAQYRWLHPIAAEVFRIEDATPPHVRPAEAVTMNGARHGTRTGSVGAGSHDQVRSWAHLVARLLIPAPAR
jgi:hypothetical protein